MTTHPPATRDAGPALQDTFARAGELAQAFQEAFTVAVRIRANRQAPADAASFRAHIKTLIGAADRAAKARGYDQEYVKLAVYAYAAFLDETVLHFSPSMFAEWTQQPLQQDIFGDALAGENFFRYLMELLGRQDSSDLADLLEVYLLCLQLGFQGKYPADDASGLHGLKGSIQQKIQRIRAELGPARRPWTLPPDEVVEAGTDLWLKRLFRVTIGAAAVALLLYLFFRFLLGQGIDGVRGIAG